MNLIDELIASLGTFSDDDLAGAEWFATTLERLVSKNGRRHSFARLTSATGGEMKVAWCVHRAERSERQLAAGDKIIVRGAAGIDIGTVQTLPARGMRRRSLVG